MAGTMRLDGKDEAPWQEQMKRSGVFGLDQGPFTVPPPLPHTHTVRMEQLISC